MKYLHIILANLKRKKFRTILTIGSFAAALFLFGLLTVIDKAMNSGADFAGADRLLVINKVSLIMPLPYAYLERIRQIEGIEEVTFSVWFGGVYQDPKNFFPNIAIDTGTYRRVYSDIVIADGQWNDFLADRQGAIVGQDLAKRFGWKIGDRIPLEGTIWPGVWEFNIRGIWEMEDKSLPSSDFYFRYDYLEEQRPWGKGTVGWYIVKVTDPSAGAGIVSAIDGRFENSPYETKTDTEKVFLTGFANQIGNIRLIIISVGAVVFITLLLVTGNTMAISVRERTGELAVLKTLGFSDAGVLGLVVSESLLISGIGGLIGLALVKLFTLGGDPTGGFLQVFYLPPEAIGVGFLIALLMGFVAGFIPGVNAMRLRIVTAFRRI
ncbi:MAG: ABC transporter permease [Candidatus Krumholzibacteriota bacterium]|nr:ABC transporter permease [Candidatus Krumholzibacteriota bacterium]